MSHYQNQDRELVSRSQEESSREEVSEINIANSANIFKLTKYSRSSRGRIEDVPSTNKYRTNSRNDGGEWRGNGIGLFLHSAISSQASFLPFPRFPVKRPSSLCFPIIPMYIVTQPSLTQL